MSDVPMQLVRSIRDTSAGYIAENLPSDADERLIEAMRSAALLNRSDLRALMSQLSSTDHSTLTLFAERMANYAVRTQETEWIRLGLIAIALVEDSPDEREQLLILPLLWRGAELIGQPPRPLFVDAADLVSGKMAERLRRYVTSPEVPTVSDMGFREEGSGDQFRFIRR